MIWFRREHAALRGETLDIIHQDPARRVVAYHRWDEGGDRVVTVANCSANDQGGYTMTGWPTDGPWRDILTGDVIEARDLSLAATLGPWQTRVFIVEQGS